MTMKDGAQVVIKIGNGATPTETFTTIGGLRATRLALAHRPVESSHLASGGWRALLPAAGTQSLTISGTGAFTDSAAEATLRTHAFARSVNNYQLVFGGDETVTGAFQVIEYERAGDLGEEETYRVTLESAGAITVV